MLKALTIFSGNANRDLAKSICGYVETPLGNAEVTRFADGEIYVEINPIDARRLGVRPRQWVWVVSKRGRARARAVVTPTVQGGQLFMPMHYAATNVLTFPAFDPYSRQPAYKHCAVDVVVESD